MSIEALENPVIESENPEDKESGRFPFPIETKSLAEYHDLFDKGAKSKLRSDILSGENIEKAFSEFINRNQKEAEITYTLPCKDQLISSARRYSLDLLEKRLHLSPNDMSALESLVGEILIDTIHSVRQKIRNPEFTVRINITKFGGYSFEIINQDKIPFEKWLIVDDAQEMISSHNDSDLNAHAGTMIKKIEVDQLGGKAKYIAINNEFGEKEYTSFYFEKKFR